MERQTLRVHLTELRRRLTWSAAVVFLTTVIAFIFHQQILQVLMAPAGNFTELPQNKPVYTELTEFIGIAMKASLFVGIFGSLPFLLWQMVMFSAPGLNPTEKRYLYFLMPITILVFLAGSAFGYFMLFPPAVKFLLTFGSNVATPMIRIGNYINLMLSLLFWMGIVFELPIILFFLSRIGVVSPEFLARNRRWAIVISFVLGAIITPTLDPINQAFVAGPIIVLYEVGVLLSKVGTRMRGRNS
ncbi:MAG: twin arginine-targeting protein translocase TatC [SAR202 cluster bacterium Ae2-Chloro-G2]|nr:MAG: twin arginine-targeting protein translocase TatC [SAR202 cluster bacterium Ae2-Chloro-G2]